MAVSSLSSAFDVLGEEQRSCPKHGSYTSRHLALRGRDHGWTPCRPCDDDMLAEEGRRRSLEILRRSRVSDIDRLLQRAAIPPRFLPRTFENFDGTGPRASALEAAQKYARNFHRRLDAGACLAFIGNPGTGKTHLAAAIARVLLLAGRAVVYVKVLDYLRVVRECWHKEALRDELEVIKVFVDPDLLILDEVGMQYGTEGERVQLTDLLDKRYGELRPTLILSNCSREELAEYLGVRAFDRLREGGGELVVFDWDSYRSTSKSWADRDQ